MTCDRLTERWRRVNAAHEALNDVLREVADGAARGDLGSGNSELLDEMLRREPPCAGRQRTMAQIVGTPDCLPRAAGDARLAE